MLEKASRLAESVAASVSRRGFLGVMGRWAAAAALGVAGALAGAGRARADFEAPCCYYGGCCTNPKTCKVDGNTISYCFLEQFGAGPCPATFTGCNLVATLKIKGENGCPCP
jgi:hypothetical protein